MPQSKAHIQATTRYERKAYDRINLRLRKDGDLTKHRIQKAADAKGESLNQYVMKAIEQRIQSDN